jgi:hypothetical protein
VPSPGRIPNRGGNGCNLTCELLFAGEVHQRFRHVHAFKSGVVMREQAAGERDYETHALCDKVADQHIPSVRGHDENEETLQPLVKEEL